MSTNNQLEDTQRPYGGRPDSRCLPHYVQRGETLDNLASQYGISPEFLVRANPSLALRAGQTICIPRGRRY